jgi:type VI secretion system protein ImpL
MKKLFGLIFNRWVLIAVLLLCMAIVVWVIGPQVSIGLARPLETESSRWITIGVITLIVVLFVGIGAWRARRGNAAVVRQLMTEPAGDKKAAESADMVAVRERFERALLTLRRARFGQGGLLSGMSAKFGGRYLYELPWYLIIGAPGSGKTTALQNCGLKFPLADKVGDYAIKGVGGTRNCDWWFTDQAVLIDTAGRFTTQDSDRENDRATWSGFLGMLKRARPRQPLNGVMVTVSITDLLTKSPSERAQHAATVRQRVQELHEDLGIRFPIYLLVTKCDLLAGFMDYFATLDKDQRATPWGFTFKLEEQTEQGLERFAGEFAALQQRLTDGLVDRLQSDRDIQRRARIYSFPSQFAGLKQVLQDFAESVFSPSRFEANPLLRGVYFVSGTQEGTPIDRMLGSIARSYKLERAIIAPNQSSGKSFFLTRLLGEVVFAESGIAGTNLRWERRRTVLAVAGYAALACLTVGAVTAWTVSYLNNRKYVDQVSARVDDVRKLVQSTPNRASPELLPILPALEATRALAQPRNDGTVPWSLGFGLYQGDKLDGAARQAYQRMLVDAFLPRLALRVEEQLRISGSAPETQYEALKAYVMLYDPEHFNAESLKRYIELDWDAKLSRDVTTEQREALSQHLDALLAQGAAVSPLPEDKPLVTNVRTALGSEPLPKRIYNRMRHAGFGGDFPEFTIPKAGGSSAALVFTRASGAPLTKGVPGLFSYNGYYNGFQKQVGKVSAELADEQSWVLGINDPEKNRALKAINGDPLLDDVRRIYLTEYANTWEAFIADIRMLPLTSLPQSVQAARILSASDSPLPPLMKGISRETTLLAAPSKAGGLLDKAESKANDLIKQTTRGLLPQQLNPSGPRIESIVDDRFAGLRQLTTAPEGGKAPIDDTVSLIGELYVRLNAVQTAVQGGATPPPSAVENKVASEAPRLPQPVRALVMDLSRSSSQNAQLIQRQVLGGDVKSQVGDFCQLAIAGRYPLDRGSRRDVTQADFATVFGPGGKLDKVFQEKLAPFVDTSTKPWRFRAVEGGPLGTDSGTLPQFQRGATIRETFFAGGSTPSLRLDFKPVEMDKELSQFILDVDGQVVRYAHGPQIPTNIQWPGPRGSSQVRVQVTPPGASGTSGIVEEGPWALFRLFERVRIEPGNAPEKFRATFDVDGRKAVFDVTTSSVRNPFRLPELGEFRCPGTL